MKDMKIKAGDTIKYEIPITGEPTPEVIWSMDNTPLKHGVNRCKMSTENAHAMLEIENAERGHSGQYSLTLRNPSGEADAKTMVSVISKPQPPVGPLQLTDINKQGCTLSWITPEDDGGEPLEGRYAVLPAPPLLTFNKKRFF